MNANAKAWLDALRSGNYIQGSGRLLTITPDGDLYCCLGVACDISGLGRWKDGAYHVAPPEDARYDESEYYDAIALPLPVRQWLGMRSAYGDYLTPDGEVHSLAMLNDGQRTTPDQPGRPALSFDSIADFIQDHEAQLFYPDTEEH